MAEIITPSISSVTKIFFQNTQPLTTTFSGTVNRDFEHQPIGITKVYFQNYASGSPTSVDLTSLTDAYGVAITFATVAHLMIVNNDSTNSVTVGGGSNGLFAALPPITAGGCFNLTTSFTVDSTHKILLFTPAAGTPSIDLVLFGT